MKPNFIIDEEIKLVESNDFLNTGVYAKTLKAMVDGAPMNRPFTIGLFGEWGSGKSSIISTVRDELEKESLVITKFAVFDAWKYSGDAFRRSFILSVQEQLSVKLDRFEHNLYENINQQIKELKFRLNPIHYLILAGILIIFGISYIFSPHFKDFLQSFMVFFMLLAANSFLFVVLKKIFKDDLLSKILEFISAIAFNKYDVEKPLLFSPEQFAKSFETILEKATPNNGRIVIVIDNIDRCEKDYATELLSTIKGFLEYKEKVLFILPVDDGALKKHIKQSFGASDRDADEFLRKFFNVNLRIKPYTPTEIYDFAKRISSKYNLGFKDETLDLVSKEFATNPRRIIQMFNNLSSELLCFDTLFSKEHEIEIAKLLIIREEFPEYYVKLAKNPFIINEPSEAINSFLKIDKSEGIRNFINKTQVLTEATSIVTFNKILSNSKVFNSLPQEIQVFIDTLNVNKIIEFINSDEGKKEIITDYLIKTLDEYTERNLYSATYINSLDILIHINENLPLSLSINIRIEEIIRPNISKILAVKNRYENLITYSKFLLGQSRAYLKEFLISYLIQELTKENYELDFHLDAFKKFLLVYDNDESISQFEQVYENLYSLSLEPIEIQKLSSFQVKHLISLKLKKQIIGEIQSIELSDIKFSEVMFLLENTENSADLEDEILKQTNKILNKLFNKTASEISDILVGTNLLLSKLSESNGDALTELFNTITGDRKVENPNYPTLRNYDTTLNYVDESISNEGSVRLISEFCTNVFILESVDNDTESVFNKLILSEDGANIVNSDLVKLANLNMEFTPLKSLILSDKSYSKDNIELVKYLIEFKNTKSERIITDEQISEKISEVLKIYFENPSAHLHIIEMLESLVEDKSLKLIVTKIISALSMDNILKLSDKLKKLCLDIVLDGDKIFEFETNNQFLSFVATNGEKSHIIKLVNLLIRMIQVNSSLEQALKLITLVRRFNSKDANRLTQELKERNDNEQFKDLIKSSIRHIESTITR